MKTDTFINRHGEAFTLSHLRDTVCVLSGDEISDPITLANGQMHGSFIMADDEGDWLAAAYHRMTRHPLRFRVDQRWDYALAAAKKLVAQRSERVSSN